MAAQRRRVAETLLGWMRWRSFGPQRFWISWMSAEAPKTSSGALCSMTRLIILLSYWPRCASCSAWCSCCALWCDLRLHLAVLRCKVGVDCLQGYRRSGSESILRCKGSSLCNVDSTLFNVDSALFNVDSALFNVKSFVLNVEGRIRCRVRRRCDVETFLH
jgi:hypothetical protein